MKKYKNISWHDLLKETGYFEIYDGISVQDIREILKKNQEYVKDWLLFSKDQRCTPSWYFKENADEENYMIGYVTKDINYTDEQKFSNPLDACANFIKNIVEQTRRIK